MNRIKDGDFLICTNPLYDEDINLFQIVKILDVKYDSSNFVIEATVRYSLIGHTIFDAHKSYTYDVVLSYDIIKKHFKRLNLETLYN